MTHIPYPGTVPVWTKLTLATANPLVVPAATPPARKRAAATVVTPIARATTDHLQPRPRHPSRGLGSFHEPCTTKRPLQIRRPFQRPRYPASEGIYRPTRSTRRHPIAVTPERQQSRPPADSPSVGFDEEIVDGPKGRAVKNPRGRTHRGLTAPLCAEPRQARHLLAATQHLALAPCLRA